MTVKVLDQYGVVIGTPILYTAKNIVENPNGYAENNFTVSGNANTTFTVSSGAERGDVFDLLLKAGNAEATTAITVGDDENANISSAGGNNYLRNLIGNGRDDNLLEQQRKVGLGIPIV